MTSAEGLLQAALGCVSWGAEQAPRAESLPFKGISPKACRPSGQRGWGACSEWRPAPLALSSSSSCLGWSVCSARFFPAVSRPVFALGLWLKLRCLQLSGRKTLSQCCAGQCLTTGSLGGKTWICSICWISWYKYSHHDWFQATSLRSRSRELRSTTQIPLLLITSRR